MSKPTKRPTLTLVSNGDDWEGLYIDGVLVNEGHTITLGDLAEAFDCRLTRVDVLSDWLGGEVGRLPDKLTDIPKTAICS